MCTTSQNTETYKMDTISVAKKAAEESTKTKEPNEDNNAHTESAAVINKHLHTPA